jgi:surfeit locus 1 family protein
MNRRMIFPILLGLVGCAILVALGVWQLQRMAWKAEVIAQIEAQIHQAPVALPATPTPDHDRYLAVTVTGRLTGEQVQVLSSSRDGGPGVRVIAAFETGDGRRILIDLGFLPEDQRAQPLPAKAATVTGNLDWPRDSDSYTPPPDAKTGLWFSRDATAISQALGTEATLIVAGGPVVDGIAPTPVDTSSIPNNHWEYVITWFSLALVWAVMTVYLLWRIRQRSV